LLPLLLLLLLQLCCCSLLVQLVLLVLRLYINPTIVWRYHYGVGMGLAGW
jgi:hypothetical protein